MIDYNTIGNNLKRGLVRFSNKVAIGFTKPKRKFIADMIYGITAGASCKLTDIGRALKEDISLKKIVERLGRNLSSFDESERAALSQNYLETVNHSIGSDSMILIDASDVAKPCSPKMEAIGSVKDGSTGEYAIGYWTMGATALSDENKQPIPVYESLYPCKKQGGLGFSVEAEKCLQYLRENFDKGIPRVLDRGFDSGDIIFDFVTKEEKFIMRASQNRVAILNGKRTYIHDIARGMVCEDELIFRGKDGNEKKCGIGMKHIVLPNLKNARLNLVVCKGYGETPLVLYTNLSETIESMAVRIVKAYLMRWRIDEFYGFKKQGLQFEDFRVRSLNSIRTLDLLLTIATGFIGMLCEDAGSYATHELIATSKRIPKIKAFLEKTKIFYYAVLAGITRVLGALRCGISGFFASKPRDYQLCIAGFEKMG
jgi:hypothetical protein